MKDINEAIALKLKQIDLSKIPTHSLEYNRSRHKIDRVFLYISELKKFISVDIKLLKWKALDINLIMKQDNLNIFNTNKNIYYYFYNIDEFKKDYPNSAIEIFEKQENVYHDIQQTDKYLMRYAWLYQNYSFLEQVIKSGLSDLIYNLIYRNSMNYYRLDEIFNVHGKNICEITGLTKAYFQIVRDNIKNIDSFIEIKNFLKNHKVSPQQFNRLINIIKNNSKYNGNRVDVAISRSLNTIDDLLAIEYNQKHLYTFNTLMNYIERQSIEQGYTEIDRFVGVLYDYVKMCVEINIKPDIKTKNLQREHNVTIVQYNQLKDEEADKKYNDEFNTQYLKLKEYEYQDNRLEVIAPKKPKDIIEEGRHNHNCVGSYLEAHASGKSNIFFIRKIDELNKSYITIELDENLSKVKQAYYSYNKVLNNIDNNFIEKWMKQIETRRQIDG